MMTEANTEAERVRGQARVCPICETAFTVHGMRRANVGRANTMICGDCSVCRCGSGKPPGLCHGESRSRLFVRAA